VDHALERFRADDGGFHDTASDAEALVARPRDPTDNASPSGLSAMVHALLTAAAMTGDGSYEQAAEDALGTVAALAMQAPRFTGWSLAAAEALAAGPLEVAVVGPTGAARDELERTARRAPGVTVVVAEQGNERIPLLAGRGPVDGEPAAYVCRRMVCDRPVTTTDDLVRLVGGPLG
ncbi:MAG: N-acylglucosamine 2-epimerase, partial [Nocardioides sp.]